MALATNLAASATLACSIAFYVFIYTTWLKRRTPQNIVIGGAAGAFPPMVGWAAVTGSIDVMPLLMFAIIFFWTPPHFWALSLYAHADYARAGVPMLPVVAGARSTRRHIMFYTWLLAPLSLLPWAFGYAGVIYGLSAALLAVGFLVHVWRVSYDRQDQTGVSMTRDAPARAAFRYSIIYLFALFGALAVDHAVGWA
jgi:protoheme IX farnesyltransferase